MSPVMSPSQNSDNHLVRNHLSSHVNCYKSTIYQRIQQHSHFASIISYSPPTAILPLLSSSNQFTMMSRSYHKLAELSRSLGPAEPEAASGGDFQEAGLSWTRSPPNVAHLPDVHRCNDWSCPICHPSHGIEGDSPQMLAPYAGGTVIQFGDGGHTCRKFPCPVCNNGR